MIVEHFATSYSENEIDISNRIASCQIGILLSAFLIVCKKLHSKWNLLYART